MAETLEPVSRVGTVCLGAFGQLGVTLGDKLSADVRENGLVLKPARKSYALTGLMAQCDLKAAPPADLKDWTDARPVGQEVW
jgi:antitoxin ChpS